MTYKFLDLTGLKQTITQIFSKLKAVALSGSYTDLINRPTIVNNGTTTTTNTVLDGRMGKTLADKDANLQSQITSLNSALINKIDNLQRTKPVEYVNNFFMGGVSFFIINSDVAHQIDLPDSSWWYVLHIAKPDNTGFAVQFFIELAGAGRVLRRWSSESAWVGRNW